MKMKQRKSIKLLIRSMVLVAVFALFLTGCKDKNSNQTPISADTKVSVSSDTNVLGEGKMAFTFTSVDQEGNETKYEIHTDKETVGEALLEHNLIAGEEGEYGLYVKTVNGITVDYDKDGEYWAFYINEEYAQTSVDLTNVQEGDSYSFKVEK